MVTINLFSVYRLEAGVKSFQLDIPDETTTAQAILKIVEKYPALRPYWISPDEELYPNVIVILNGKDIHALPEGVKTRLHSGDQLGFFSPGAGG
jgi:molybdopterin converting factor small subunit